jgi:hypothetical protein
LQQSFHAGCFRDGRAAGVEVVHQRADSGERFVAVQAESRQQLLERDLVPAVGKGCAFEAEPDRGRRTRLRLLQPHQGRFRIDEAPDQPTRGEAVSQQRLAGRPDALEIVAAGLGQAAAGPGCVREHPLAHLGLGLTQRPCRPLFQRRIEEVQSADRFELAALLVENSSDRARFGNTESRVQPFDSLDQLLVFSRAVEHRLERPLLLGATLRRGARAPSR